MKAEIKIKAIRRLKIVEGQLRALRTMVESEEYCIDIITQSSAVRKAVSGVEDLIMENHLLTHVVHQIKSGHITQAKNEILKVYKLKGSK